MSVWGDLVFRFLVKPKLRRLSRKLPEAKIFPCGSRYVCDPPVVTTDVDFLVYSETDLATTLLAIGYLVNQSPLYANRIDFKSWRRGSVNLIVTTSSQFANQHNIATYVCKSRNLTDKWHRILVYEAFRGNYDDHFIPDSFPRELDILLKKFAGIYGDTMQRIYMEQNNIAGV